MASIDENVRQQILAITGFCPGVLSFRYLGIPLAARHLRSLDYSLLVDAITDRINSWPRQSLSYAGKIELIRSVIQSMECFWLTILPVPSCIIDIIHSICRKFVWPTKRPPIVWDMLCKPTVDGGMCLKNLKAWNKALIAKTLWKIHMKKDSLWIRWINHIYSRYDSVWCWNWKKEESPLIKQIICIKDELVQKLGSKDAAATCLDSWFASSTGLSRAYQFYTQREGIWPWKPLLAKTFVLPKHRFILLLFAHRKLLTRDRLPFVLDKTCVLCNAYDESITHLYFDCNISKCIWTGIRQWLDMKKLMGSPTAILKAYRRQYNGNSSLARMRITALAATVYQIWNLRNRALFENEKPLVEDSIRKIKIHVFRFVPASIDIMNAFV